MGEDEKQSKNVKGIKKNQEKSSRSKKRKLRRATKARKRKKNTKEEAALKKKQMFSIQRNTNDSSKQAEILKNIKNVGSLGR